MSVPIDIKTLISTDEMIIYRKDSLIVKERNLKIVTAYGHF